MGGVFEADVPAGIERVEKPANEIGDGARKAISQEATSRTSKQPDQFEGTIIDQATYELDLGSLSGRSSGEGDVSKAVGQASRIIKFDGWRVRLDNGDEAVVRARTSNGDAAKLGDRVLVRQSRLQSRNRSRDQYTLISVLLGSEKSTAKDGVAD